MTTADRLQAAAWVRERRAANLAWEVVADRLAVDLYVLDRLSILLVAELVSLSRTGVRRRLASAGVEVRPQGRPLKQPRPSPDLT